MTSLDMTGFSIRLALDDELEAALVSDVAPRVAGARGGWCSSRRAPYRSRRREHAASSHPGAAVLETLCATFIGSTRSTPRSAMVIRARRSPPQRVRSRRSSMPFLSRITPPCALRSPIGSGV